MSLAMAKDDKERDDRLAAALRENLRRRKAQARAQDGARPDSATDDQESGDTNKKALSLLPSGSRK